MQHHHTPDDADYGRAVVMKRDVIYGYFARHVFRWRPYESFFREQSESRYVWRLLTGRSISVFRDPHADGWGPHLGFDWRVVLDLNESPACRILRVDSLVFGYILVARRA